jgi:dienelactone hydrolase
MNTSQLFTPASRRKAYIFFCLCLTALAAAVILASQVQSDFGRLSVSNVTFQNYNGIPVRAKLLHPVDASASSPLPGLVYIHGYQNNRETADPYCIELARRGFVMLCIDAIGRGNSGNPNDINDPNFDETYGGKWALLYLKSLPYVDAQRVGMMGHSLGAEMAYTIALQDPTVKALSISGFAYGTGVTPTNPQNMLMIFGKYDEYRQRMTGTKDFAAEWMNSPQTKAAITAQTPQFGVTYGSFANGSARRVFMPSVTHIQESHNRAAVAEAVEWMRQALQPDEKYWVDAKSQIWEIKEVSTLVAMFAGLVSLLPLGLVFLTTPFFASLRGTAFGAYVCTTKQFIKSAVLNGVLMWLYLPLVLVLFAVHLYLVPIDTVFPMMMVNGIVFWFLVINIIGFFIFLGWYKKQHKIAAALSSPDNDSTAPSAQATAPSLEELGISFKPDRFSLNWAVLGKTLLLGLILAGFAILCEYILEALFIVDYRFLFPLASDLTAYRWLMLLLYFPFLLLGFLQIGIFLHGQLRLRVKRGWFGTFVRNWLVNMAVLIVPILIHLLAQYVPLFTVGVIPFVGPDAALVGFVINLMHIVVVLIIASLISTWFHQLTGKIYLGALVNALIVAWMFASSQVIAPIPV